MRLPNPFLRSAAALILAVLAIPLWSSQIARAASNNDDYDDAELDSPASRVGRVSRLEGEASLRQSGSNDWEDVGTNSPVFEGDEFYTSDGTRMEIQLGGGRYLRLDERTDVVFAFLDEESARVEVSTGTVIISLRQVDGKESFQISAPAAAVTLREEGVYRVNVDDDGNTIVAVRSGNARVSGTQQVAEVESGESARFSYNDPSDVDLVSYVDDDGFDSWSSALDDRYDDYYAQSNQYVNSINNRTDIYGLAELGSYGSWFDTGQYGYCWRPNVGLGWQPYSNGYWKWYPGYGYTWVSYDSWGWAPFHYGRWEYLNGYGWSWIPWSQFGGGSYYWSPAQVYWCNYPGYNGYAWVPLAPNEPSIDYRRFDRRHDRDFVPRHLRAGRGIGVTQPGSGARLQPIANVRPIKGSDFGGRSPVAINPARPKDLTPVKPRFKPVIAEPVRMRPVVVARPDNGTATPRRPVTERRQTRAAATETNNVIVKPTRPKNDTPSLVQTRPVGRPDNDRKPVLRPDDTNSGGTVVAKPRRSSDDDRPKPRRVEPVGPSNDNVTVDRQPKGDRAPRVERESRPKVDVEQPREQPRRVEQPREQPRRVEQPREQPRQERNVERSAPRVERSAPAPRVERAPSSGGGERSGGGGGGGGGSRSGGGGGGNGGGGGRNKPN